MRAILCEKQAQEQVSTGGRAEPEGLNECLIGFELRQVARNCALGAIGRPRVVAASRN